VARVTSSDAPQPPGGPLRQDAPAGDMQPDDEDLDSPETGETEHGSEGGKPAPAVSHEPSQSDDESDLQEENAETSLDQPSS
jgi:hypothetical protein